MLYCVVEAVASLCFFSLQGKSKMKSKKKNERAVTDDKSKIYLYLFFVWCLKGGAFTLSISSSNFVPEPMGMCVTEPFTALLLTSAPGQNQMMLMEHPNPLAIPTQSLYLRHPNSLS